MAGKRTELAVHLSAGELKERARARKGVDPKETRRWQALWLFSQGQSARQVSATTGLSVSWLAEIKRRYNAEGAASVADGHRRQPGGARSLLSEEQRRALAAAIEATVPARLGGGLWSGRKVASWVKAATGHTIRPQQGCVYLRQLGFGLRVPRPRHRRAASPEEQAAFKKKLAATVAQVQATHPQARVEVWAQDEARLGLKPIVRRVWARRGRSHRPLCAGDHRYQWMYVFGFVRPANGRTEWWLCGGVNTPAMSAVLAEFARAVGAGAQKRVLLVLDRAGWHVAKDLVIPEGIHLVHLPASTPELQPAERLWPPLREAVANESFADLEALDVRLSERCSQLSTQTSYVAACTRYHWWPET